MNEDPYGPIPNHAKLRLESGNLVLCMGVRLGRTADIARIARAAGFDALFVDMEHSPITTESASQICTAALDAGVTPLVRVPGHEHHHAARVLDCGAMGVIVPHVDTVDQARKCVLNCKFPPIGHRSVSGLMPQLGYMGMPATESTSLLNENTLLTVMLETPEAIKNVDAIASVEGIDQVMIGTNDLCATMGIHGQLDHVDVINAYQLTAEACKKNNKHLAIGGISIHNYPELLQKIVNMGARFILGGADIFTLIAACRSDVQAFRKLDIT
ncbi:MAG: aldolase/citrate lyase family protein [Pseudomonadota bacterium]|nr:aldolase/citrate lyase family protein [Pseudomonadota bacterium]